MQTWLGVPVPGATGTQKSAALYVGKAEAKDITASCLGCPGDVHRRPKTDLNHVIPWL